MNTSRSPNQATKTEVLKRQKFKCANKPGSNLTNILDYKCPFWEYRDGNFEDTDYEFDHILEYSKGGLNDAKNIQALCPNCHRKKTNNYLKKQEQTKIISNNDEEDEEEDEEDDEKVIFSKNKLDCTIKIYKNAIETLNERVVENIAKNIEKDEIYNHLLKNTQKLKSERDLLKEENETLKKSKEDEEDEAHLYIKMSDFQSEQNFFLRTLENLSQRVDKKKVENKTAKEQIDSLTKQIDSLTKQNEKLRG